jgi:hypothetical protein
VVHAKFHGQHPVVVSVINVLVWGLKVGLQHLLHGTVHHGWVGGFGMG